MKIYLQFLILMLFVTVSYGQYSEVRGGINEIIAQVPAGTNYSILIIDAETMDTVYTRGHRLPMIPASNTKVVTSAAALHLLGGDYQLATELRYSGRVDNSGTLNGSIYLRARGNPFFTSKDLENFAGKVKQQGIRVIEGDVIGDDTFFDELYDRSQYVGSGEGDYETYPLSALVVDKNTFLSGQKFTSPPVAIARRFKQLLVTAGIVVKGEAVVGETPVNNTLITTVETKLSDLLKTVNKRSDNFLAEYAMKLISAAVNGERGNTKNGIKLCMAFLNDCGAYLKGTTLADGSGLSRRNYIPTGVIVSIYQYIYSNIVFRSQFYSTLSISGVDGTLRGRMQDANGENNLHGKTGTLSGVITLSGYFKTKKGRDLIGAVFFNYSVGYPDFYRGLQDQIFEYLINTL
ncbi:MAG: D-alanyl-D-alanine carboxypeptidase/D-alanyl-D-alanine-endopeptidase [Ignavibacteriales bacterium]|nr:D-alanyl-D-alanine carboxypeptidase/D-alanyl-D-alanine-endopeptidase [Ignavibacteriales bacterium]